MIMCMGNDIMMDEDVWATHEEGGRNRLAAMLLHE